MQDDLQFILSLLATTRNGNMPVIRLCEQYGLHLPASTFEDALSELINAGMVERVQLLHVKLR